MKFQGTYVATNSANATMICSTKPCLFFGANIDKGPGSLTILDGTSIVLSISSPTLTTPGSVTPLLPIVFSRGLNATCSGTGICTLFWAINN